MQMITPSPLGVPTQPAHMGWQCPCCRKVHAPFVRECLCATLLSNVSIPSAAVAGTRVMTPDGRDLGPAD